MVPMATYQPPVPSGQPAGVTTAPPPVFFPMPPLSSLGISNAATAVQQPASAAAPGTHPPITRISSTYTLHNMYI